MKLLYYFTNISLLCNCYFQFMHYILVTHYFCFAFQGLKCLVGYICFFYLINFKRKGLLINCRLTNWLNFNKFFDWYRDNWNQSANSDYAVCFNIKLPSLSIKIFKRQLLTVLSFSLHITHMYRHTQTSTFSFPYSLFFLIETQEGI